MCDDPFTYDIATFNSQYNRFKIQTYIDLSFLRLQPIPHGGNHPLSKIPYALSLSAANQVTAQRSIKLRLSFRLSHSSRQN